MTTKIEFNKDSMTLYDLKKCAEGREAAANHVEAITKSFQLWQEERHP
jgi:hypothetical protein